MLILYCYHHSEFPHLDYSLAGGLGLGNGKGELVERGI